MRREGRGESSAILETALERTARFPSRFGPGFHGRLGTLAVDHQDFADVLYSRRTQVFAYPAQGIRPGVAVFARHPDLDQFMGVQATIDFLEHRRSQAVIADSNHGIEGVGTGLERAALTGGQLICQ